MTDVSSFIDGSANKQRKHAKTRIQIVRDEPPTSIHPPCWFGWTGHDPSGPEIWLTIASKEAILDFSSQGIGSVAGSQATPIGIC